MNDLPDYEKLGVFYLGKKYDLANRQTIDEKVLYDAKDMTTHALCVGMTGSGKTGLCISLLEEAAIDGIPAIAIDPKGDIGNLLLTFPDLQPANFQEWLEPAEATRKGITLEELAQKTADQWRDGLAQWEQDAARIQRLRDAIDVSIYTPGSSAGIPLTVLKSFDAPDPIVREDAEIMREKVSGAASGILTLLGIDSDPLNSKEHILLSNLFDLAWRSGNNLSIPELIRQIQSPPIQRVGVLDLESFLPASERSKLAMGLNNLLASPSFAGWMEGESLDIQRLLYTKEGKPRLSIISIAHLSDSERMFFVTLLLDELLAWVRTQPGTSSLRALFYMDEVFGYFPPNSKPPSKLPMLTLLKQARAFGLGIVLATQNPVDLDYKGLSNMGTWFLGRLQTERDKLRVLDGLEGAATQAGSKFDRSEMEKTLSALGSRVFLMNNVHDDEPTIFQSRWALSFLRGPLSRQQIQKLMAAKKAELKPTASEPSSDPASNLQQASSSTAASKTDSNSTAVQRPILPAGIEERFAVANSFAKPDSKLVYRPALFGIASQHFVKAATQTDIWVDYRLLLPLHDGMPEDLWQESQLLKENSVQFENQPTDSFQFAELPTEVSSAKKFAAWEKGLKDYLYRHEPLRLLYCKAIDQYSKPSQSEDEARALFSLQSREERDRQMEKLKAKYAPKLQALQTKIANAQQRVAREQEQASQQKLSSFLNVGTSILNAIMGKKLVSKSNLSKASTAARSMGRAAQQQGDVARAVESLEQLQTQAAELDTEFRQECDLISSQFQAQNLSLETIEIPGRKTDTQVKSVQFVWIPWQISKDGEAKSLI